MTFIYSYFESLIIMVFSVLLLIILYISTTKFLEKIEKRKEEQKEIIVYVGDTSKVAYRDIITINGEEYLVQKRRKDSLVCTRYN